MKLGILLPASSSLRTLRRAALLGSALIEAGRGEVSICIGLSEPDDRKWRAGEGRIHEIAPEVIVRHLEWTRIAVANAGRMFFDLPESLDLHGLEFVVVPRDWGWNFQDCDFWINMAHPRTGAPLPRRPTAHYCGDLVQRYVPTSIAASINDEYWDHETEAFRIWRQGLVITSDPTVVSDIVSYAGVRRERIEVVPDLLDRLDPLPVLNDQERDPHLVLWHLEGNAVDDLENCLLGLSTYYRENGHLEFILAHDANVSIEHHLGAAVLPHDLLAFYKELRRFPYHSLAELDRMLQRVGAVWSSRMVGGEGEHYHDAVRAGVALLAPKIPETEAWAQRPDVETLLYPLDRPLAIADRLRELEAATEAAVGPRAVQSSSARDDAQARWGFFLERLLEHAYA